jgi:hypothetical protein
VSVKNFRSYADFINEGNSRNISEKVRRKKVRDNKAVFHGFFLDHLF